MSLENYKKRFYTLLESELGNVKPLLNEQNQQPAPQQPNSNLDPITQKFLGPTNVGANFKPKEQQPVQTLKNLPNITIGGTPGTLKLCPSVSPSGQPAQGQCMEREVKVCFRNFCLKIIFDKVKIRPDNGDLEALVRPNSKFLQNIFKILPKTFTDKFLSNGAIKFQGDTKGVNYAVQQLKQGVRNVQIPIGYGVYALIV